MIFTSKREELVDIKNYNNENVKDVVIYVDTKRDEQVRQGPDVCVLV